ncbi:MAG: NAD(P)/FAD-dependent oxidoreductase [Clostridiaceae bacterium]|nr:NAD(P)/FAD-dependent oxidoreductase [Clostridiaceae bacterium]
MEDVVIIGAGVIGASIFRELTKYNVKVTMIEKENDVAMGTSKANSAIIHAGFDPKKGTKMAEFNLQGNRMFEGLCKELDVPFKRNGALVLAFNKNDLETIKRLYENGKANGIEGLELLNREEVIKKEPNISEEVKGALYAPTSGIVGPFEYTIALVENGIKNGGKLLLNSKVIDIEKENEFTITTEDERRIKTRFVVNAAGLYADKIHNMVCEEKFEINPRKGEYFVLDKLEGKKFHHTLFQCPSKFGKGILVTPTVHGNLLIGPNAIDVTDKEDISTAGDDLNIIKETAIKTTEVINYKNVIRNFAGLRAIPNVGDFIIEENDKVKGFFDASGMMSPGLSSAPAIAEEIVRLLQNSGLSGEKNAFFDGKRKQIIFMNLDDKEKNELIKRNKAYGRIICRCEQITEGEILEAINRSFGSITIDGIKRRCRPGMGRCQGGFCGPKVQEIIAREYNKKMEEIEQDKKGSYILIGRSK